MDIITLYLTYKLNIDMLIIIKILLVNSSYKKL